MLRRVLVVMALGALLGGCAETELVSHTAKVLGRDGRPSAPVPKGYKLGNPYEVLGATYYPYHDPRFSEQGIASWYGEEFHGRKTASGEVYDMNSLTAAHKTLPLPSTVRVTNLDNGRTLLVRVNDRGPFVNGRIIDLSRRSAQMLGVYGTGTAKVRVEFVELAALEPADTLVASDVNPPSPKMTIEPVAQTPKKKVESIKETKPRITAKVAPAPRPPKPKNGDFALIGSAEAAESEGVTLTTPAKRSDLFVQVGAFASRDNADRLKGVLKPMGQPMIAPGNRNGQILYRVRFGPIASLEAADSLLDRLIKSGYTAARLIVETD